MADEPTSTPLNQWLASERAAADVAFHLKRGLWLLESKFSYNRWTGLVELVEIVSQLVQSRDERHRKQFLPHMAECKTQSRVFGLILDGSLSDKFTPVTSKELALSLELLLHCQRLYPWNPHSKGFTVLNRLVVETAQPLVQAPALKYARALIAAQPANAKSFRKSGGVETLGKWLKEQRGAARVISARATLDVLDLGTRLIVFLATSDAGDRKKLEAIFTERGLLELIDHTVM